MSHTKPGLTAIMASLRSKSRLPSPAEGKGQGQGLPPQPLVELLAKGLPKAEARPEAKPWIGKGEMEVGIKLPPIERQKLNNAIAKAKLGKRLTLAERKLLGKHELARIMVRLRPKGGDCG